LISLPSLSFGSFYFTRYRTFDLEAFSLFSSSSLSLTCPFLSASELVVLKPGLECLVFK
jgi:hypothetical protein